MRKPLDPDLAAWEALREEWVLLHLVADREWKSNAAETLEALSSLAEYYQARAARDEYAAVRTRMLELQPRRKGRAPGGPFPRIGVPREGERPKTLLGRWLNREDLPELFETSEITPRQLERALRVALDRSPTRDLHARIGHVLCVQLRFREAMKAYVEAGDRARQRDVLGVVRGERE